MRDLLVIGGTGLLGRALVTATGSGVDATAHTRTPEDPARWHPLELADGGADAAALIRRLQPRAVVNAAYVRHGPSMPAVTATAPGEIAAACREVGARFVHVSSDVVFDGTTDRVYREEDEPRPVHDYGRAKLAAERAVAAADPAAVVVRTSLLWGGEGDGGPQVGLVRDRTVVFFTDEIRCPLRVDRLAAACLELASRPAITGVLHVAGADAVDRLTFARLIAPLADRDPADVTGCPSDPDPGRPRALALDSSRAREVLRSPLPGVRADAGRLSR